MQRTKRTCRTFIETRREGKSEGTQKKEQDDEWDEFKEGGKEQ